MRASGEKPAAYGGPKIRLGFPHRSGNRQLGQGLVGLHQFDLVGHKSEPVSQGAKADDDPGTRRVVSATRAFSPPSLQRQPPCQPMTQDLSAHQASSYQQAHDIEPPDHGPSFCEGSNGSWWRRVKRMQVPTGCLGRSRYRPPPARWSELRCDGLLAVESRSVVGLLLCNTGPWESPMLCEKSLRIPV